MSLNTLLFFGPYNPVLAGTCYGLDPCSACRNCNYCRHCNSGGNPCGVLKSLRGIPRKTKPSSKSTRSKKHIDRPLKSVVLSSPKKNVETKIRSYSPYKRYDLNANQAPSTLRASEIQTENDSQSSSTERIPQQLQPLNQTNTIVQPCFWKLQVTPFQLSGFPDSLVGFHHWTDMRPEKRIQIWDSWAKKFLHSIYSNLREQAGERSLFESFVIYIRNDQKILVKELGGAGSKNISKLKLAVEKLNGSPDLAFPTDLQDDTVFISGQLGFLPKTISKNMWGEVQENPIDTRYQFEW